MPVPSIAPSDLQRPFASLEMSAASVPSEKSPLSQATLDSQKTLVAQKTLEPLFSKTMTKAEFFARHPELKEEEFSWADRVFAVLTDGVYNNGLPPMEKLAYSTFQEAFKILQAQGEVDWIPFRRDVYEFVFTHQQNAHALLSALFKVVLAQPSDAPNKSALCHFLRTRMGLFENRPYEATKIEAKKKRECDFSSLATAVKITFAAAFVFSVYYGIYRIANGLGEKLADLMNAREAKRLPVESLIG